MAELLGEFEQAVLLTVWSLANGAYGRAVLRGVQAALERNVASGAVYLRWTAYRNKNLIDSHLEEGSAVRAGRARRYYRLTAEGIKAMNESKAALARTYAAVLSAAFTAVSGVLADSD